MNASFHISLHILIGCLQQLLRKCLCKTKNCYTSRWIQWKTMHTEYTFLTKQLHFLQTSQNFYKCPSNLPCMFESKLGLLFLNVILSTKWKDLTFDAKNGEVCATPTRFCNSFHISLFKTMVVLNDWKIHKICRIMHPFALWLFVNCFVSSCQPPPLLLLPSLP